MPIVREGDAELTRESLLEAARDLFTERDYATVSAEELVRAAGLTRGALYHHFAGKQGAFEAIFGELEERAAARIRDAMTATSDPFERAERGAVEFLDICVEDPYRHVVLVQGPIALGWKRWRELDGLHLGGIVTGALREVVAAGLTARYPVAHLAGAFYGMLTELSFVIARASDPERARRDALRLQRDLLAGLRRPGAGEC